MELLSRSLGELGYRVTAFESAEAALAEYLAHPGDFDAVVSDLSLPRMSGLDLARRVLSVRPDLPVVLTSGYVRSEDEATARELGVLGFTLKGSFVDEIASTLDRILRREEGSPAVLYADPT